MKKIPMKLNIIFMATALFFGGVSFASAYYWADPCFNQWNGAYDCVAPTYPPQSYYPPQPQPQPYYPRPTVSTYNPSYTGSNSVTLAGVTGGNGGSINAWLEFPCYGSQYGNRYNVSAADLSASVYNLSPSTQYSYCAVAQSTQSGQIIRGNVVSFYTTSNTTFINTPSLFVTTKGASNVDKTSAVLNGTISNPSTINISGYFEYGSTVSLGSRTASQNFGYQTLATLSASLPGLSENSIYYYRTVAQGPTGEVRGTIEIFKTLTSPKTNTIYVPATDTKAITKDKEVKTPPATTEQPIIAPIINEEQNNLAAAAVLGAGGLTSNWIFWFLSAIIILLLVLIARTFYPKEEYSHVAPLTPPHEGDEANHAH